MFSKKAEKKLFKAIEDELENACSFGALYNSSHEGFAVLQEEIDEMEDEKEDFNSEKNLLWIAIKKNRFDLQYKDLIKMEIHAFKMLKENLQICAVIKKLKKTLENEKAKKEKQNED